MGALEKDSFALMLQIRFTEGTLLAESDAAARPAPPVDDGTWVWDARVAGWRADAHRYAAVRATSAGSPWDDRVPAWSDVAWPAVRLPNLREEQVQAAAAWTRVRRGVVVMPTGTGKTEVALDLMRAAAISTLVVAPVRDLMYQWHDRIRAGLGYDSGIIGDNTFNLRPVSVTTYDSAFIHMPALGNRFGFVVFDECHHLPGPVRSDAARMCAAPLRLGLTATPERADQRHLDLVDLIGPTVYELKLSAVAGRTLAPYEVVRIPVHLNEVERTRYDACSQAIRAFRRAIVRECPDFEWGDIHALAATSLDARHALAAHFEKTAIEDRAAEKVRVLEDLFRLHTGRRVIVFTGSNHMAREVSRRFLIPCLLHHCGKRERRDILEGFRAGTYPAIVANEVLDEGVDLPAAKVAIVLGGQATTRQAQQRLGRILRRQGDETALLYEVVCGETREEERSRRRRRSDAYQRTSHRPR